MPEEHSREVAGEFSLVLGILALAFSFLPIVGGLVAAPASVLAIVIGCIGIRRAERGPAINPVPAWVGTGFGLTAALLTVLVFAATSDMA